MPLPTMNIVSAAHLAGALQVNSVAVGGTVTNVTATPPLASTGGATPALSISDFIASGASHANGTVPDPGAVAGTTKFLREDASWQVPAASGFQFPIGAIYMTVDPTDPATVLGYGTWAAFATGRVVVGVDVGNPDFDTVEETGGALTVASSGTVSQPTFAGAALSTHTHGPGSYSAAAQTFAGSSAATSSDSAGTPAGTNANESTHTHSVTSNVSGTLTPAGTIAWPAGVPTHTGTAATFAGNAVAAASTQATPDLVTSLTTGSGVSPVTTATGTVTITNQGVNAWPAGVPTFTGTSSQAVSMTNPAVTSAAGSAHTHTFTGTALGTHSHTVTATGTNSASSVSGTSDATSAGTPAGTVSQPTFTGTPTSVVQPYITCYLFKRTA